MRGSSFSFDGVHPSYIGQALIANYLVNDINQTLNINAPLASLDAVAATDPYVDKDNDGFAPGPNYTAAGMTELLFLFKDPDDSTSDITVTLPANTWQLIAKALLKEIISKATALEVEAKRRGLVK
jgi:hypothetical protein